VPTQVPIEVFCIGKTVVDREEVDRWMKHIGAEEFEIPPEETVSNPALLIALAGKRCYMSFEEGLNPNVTQIRKDYVAYFDNVLGSGHGSVLEHSVFNFAMEGISRVFTAEMNRHRAGWAISEGSLRFIRFGENVPYWEPDSITGPDVLADVDCRALHEYPFTQLARELGGYFDGGINAPTRLLTTLDEKKEASRIVFRRAFGDQEEAYRVLEAIWREELAPASKFSGKKQVTSMMRRIIGLGVATGGVWSGNIRALRHVFTMRNEPAAEEEMLHVFSRVVKKMQEKEPLLFGDFYTDEDGFWRPKYRKV
jgi:thymidylate synthase (FAD)